MRFRPAGWLVGLVLVSSALPGCAAQDGYVPPAGSSSSSASAESGDPDDHHSDDPSAQATPVPPDPGPTTIDGVEATVETGRDHVTDPVDYPKAPPVGGDHSPTWVTCMGDVYDAPVPDEEAVHSLEHGAVWIAYPVDLPAAGVKTVSGLVAGRPYTFASPYPGLDRVVASAWGLQLRVDDPADPRLAEFVKQYAAGPQTPEAGAPCTPSTGM